MKQLVKFVPLRNLYKRIITGANKIKLMVDVANKLFYKKTNFDGASLIKLYKVVSVPETDGYDLVICCAFTGEERYQVLRKCIEETLHSAYNVCWVLCGSTQNDYKFIAGEYKKTKRVFGFVCDNSPLGDKWNTCIKFSGNHVAAKLLAICGSDDLLPASLIDSILSLHERDTNTIGMYGTYNWIVANRKLTEDSNFYHCKIVNDNKTPLGAGRFYSYEFLKLLNFHIFNSFQNRCLDAYGYDLVRKSVFNFYEYTLSHGIVVSVKGEWECLNSISHIINSTQIKHTDLSVEAKKVFENNFKLPTANYIMKNIIENKIKLKKTVVD